jgi:hypothetical protein
MDEVNIKGTNPAPLRCGDSSANASSVTRSLSAGVIITVGWSGDRMYSLEDVNRLYRGVKRHTTVPFDFVLCAGPEAQKPGRLDGLEAGVMVINSPYHWCWTGFKALEPGVISGDLLTLGLDVVIVGSLDDLINYPSDMAMMKDYPSRLSNAKNRDDINCEVMLLRNGKQKLIWDEWVRMGKPEWDDDIPPNERIWPMCQQGWINEKKPFPVDMFPENWIASYKLTVKPHGLPDDCRIVSFHGDPKPKECMQERFVREHWR